MVVTDIFDRTQVRVTGPEHAIAVRDLTKTFGQGSHAVEAVREINFEVERGEIFGLLGPNGAGKSTTVQMLITLVHPSSGKAEIGGVDLVTDPNGVRRIVGAALQETGLDHSLTGREALTLQARLWGASRPEARARAVELLTTVGLDGAADRRSKTYSGGMRRRLDLALALVHRPEILFLDEPTTGLDPASRRALWDEIARLNEDEGMTIVLTTQYLEEADRLADRIAIIDHGAIVREGTPDGLKNDLGGSTVVIETSSADAARRAAAIINGKADGSRILVPAEHDATVIPFLVRRLDAEHVPVLGITSTTPTLDDVFLDATGGRLEGRAGSDGIPA